MATGDRRTGRPSNSVIPPPRCSRRSPSQPTCTGHARPAGRAGPDARARRPSHLRPTVDQPVSPYPGGRTSLVEVANSFLDAAVRRASSSPTARWARCCRPPTSRSTTSTGYEGCNEILNVTRPDVVRGVHDAYLAAGADCVETNTFGANLRQPRPSTASRTASASSPRRAPGWPGSRPTRRDRRAAPVRARLDGPRHQAAHPGPRAVRPAARRLPRQRRRPDRRRRRRHDRRDLPGPAADQGRRDRRPAGDGRDWARACR